jgi:error-prone DNA polymerase
LLMPESTTHPPRWPHAYGDPTAIAPAMAEPGPYAELHCRTNFSFLEGASHPDELVVTAVKLGYAALAITDRNSVAGVVRAHSAAQDLGLKLIIGAEVTPVDAPPLVLWATDRDSYGRLTRLLTVGRRCAPKGECKLTLADLDAHRQGLIAGAAPPRHLPLEEVDYCRCREVFGDNGHLLAELHYGFNDKARLEELMRVSQASRLPLVAAGDVYYHAPHRMALQHVLTAIRRRMTVAEIEAERLPNAERHLRSIEELQSIFSQVPDAIRRTREIADRCRFSLNELKYQYPQELAPPGETPIAYLRRLAWQRAKSRYGGEIPPKVRDLLNRELDLIERLKYEAFFLTVFDVVEYARERGILCQGRGSAANSAVCFCLGVTAVDPSAHEMLFERFVSAERDEPPDIDVDFEHERREEALQYLYDKYGRDRAGLAATVISYRARSAVRDVAKALGLSHDRVDELAKNVDHRSEDSLLAERCRQSGLDPNSRLGRQLVALVGELVGFPRHLSQHVGGMVITQGPLDEMVPIENAAMENRTVIQWNKDDLDELGILKVDCLALGMLTAIRKGFDLVVGSGGPRLTIDSVPLEDPNVYEMISRADTIGVFQIESRAQMSMLPRLQPRTFYDLVIEVAIVRPGPIQGNMVHPYLRRRCGEEETTYPSPEIEHILRRTLGVPLFQEQAMQLAIEAADFTPGEADQLRRAMAAWRRPGLIDDYRRKLIDGMLAKGYSPEFSEQLFNQIRGFGEYGFPESHAASFAKLVYVSSWLKHYYPAAFAAALINSQPMGFYAPAQLIRDAREHGVDVLPIDVNASDWDCTLANRDGRIAVRLGLRLVRGLPEAVARTIEACRTRPFRSIADLTAQTGLCRAIVQRLADADAFQSLALNRRTSLWQALDQPTSQEEMPLFSHIASEEIPSPTLSELSPQEEVYADYRTVGVTLRQHPMSFLRDVLKQRSVKTAAELLRCNHGGRVSVAGLVLMRQRPGTAKGITFVTLEDETGTSNLIIHRRTWEKHEQAARRATILVATGKLERQDQVVHLVVEKLEAGPAQAIIHRSRDFH